MENPNSSQNSVNNYDEKSTLGLNTNVSCLLVYLLSYTLIVPIIFMLLEKNSKTIKFHSMQSLIIGAIAVFSTTIFNILPIPFEWLFRIAISVGALILVIMGMIKTYQKQSFNIPVISDMSSQLIKNINK